MHSVDQTTDAMVRSVLAYAENRLRMSPVPLDKGTRTPAELYARAGRRSSGTRAGQPDEVLGVYSSVIAPSIISADSPRFLGFIPAAPTKASLLFDMLISCASIQGISWLEASGAIAAENTRAPAHRRRGRAAGRRRAAASSPADRPATCPRSRWPGRPASGGSAGTVAGPAAAGGGRRGRALLDRQHPAAAGDGRAGGGHARPPADRRRRVQAAIDARPDVTDVVAVVCTSGTTNAGHHRRPRRGRRDRARTAAGGSTSTAPTAGPGIFAPVAASRSTTASSRPTRSSSTRTSGCSRPFDCCALLYRDPELARATHTQDASYLDVIHDRPTASGTRPTTPTT